MPLLERLRSFHHYQDLLLALGLCFGVVILTAVTFAAGPAPEPAFTPSADLQREIDAVVVAKQTSVAHRPTPSALEDSLPYGIGRAPVKGSSAAGGASSSPPTAAQLPAVPLTGGPGGTSAPPGVSSGPRY